MLGAVGLGGCRGFGGVLPIGVPVPPVPPVPPIALPSSVLAAGPPPGPPVSSLGCPSRGRGIYCPPPPRALPRHIVTVPPMPPLLPRLSVRPHAIFEPQQLRQLGRR